MGQSLLFSPKDTAAYDAPPEGMIAPDEFFAALRESRLLHAADVALFETQLRPGELPVLFDLLVEDGHLTRYQLGRLARGEGRGLRVGPYHVLDELGRGGGGQVFLARHSVMRREVALKLMASTYSCSVTARDHFHREAGATTGLRHPNVVLTYDANEADGALYLAMELIAGPTLQGYVDEHGPLPVALACAIVRETARGLDHAHEHGVVHRDIKPANIMLPGVGPDPDDPPAAGPLVKVVDFGLARFARQDDTIDTGGSATLGTPAFMAPEQVTDIHAADIRSDLYSLGCSFYFALTGRYPFEAASLRATLMMHLERDPHPVQALRPDVSPALAAIVHRLMAKDRAARYQTPAQLVAALNGILLGEPGCDASVPPARPEASQPEAPPRRSPTAGDAAAVRHVWHEWTTAVADTVRADADRLPEDDYRVLYTTLVHTLHAADGAPGLPDDLLGRARGLAEPWVTLAAIDRLDPRARAELYQSCRAVDVELSPPAPTPAGRGWLVAVACAALALASFTAGWAWLGRPPHGWLA